MSSMHRTISGDVLIFAAGVEHSARSTGGAAFLLTVAYVEQTRGAGA